MTKNEYIASIMLEAADLLKEDAYDDEYELDSILTEAAEYDNDNIYYLNEAVDELKEINSIKKEIKNSKDIDDGKLNKLISKVKNAVNNLLKWYYKIEPNKKFKALHTVLVGFNIVLSIALSAAVGASVSLGTYNAITYANEQRYTNGVFKAAEAVADDFRKRGMNVNFDSKNAKKAVRKNSIYGKRAKKYIIITILLTALVALVAELRKYSNEKFNMVDYASNEKEIQSQIDKIDKQISKSGDNQELINHLNKLKNKYFALLIQLRTMKNSYDAYGKKGL